MDHSKIDNFSKTHPGESFPVFRSLSSGECAVVRTRVLALLELEPDASGLDILKALHSRDGRHLGEVSLEQPVDLRVLLHGLPPVAHHQVLLNWYHFDEIDVIDVDDLSKNFDDIWYPSVDDVEIFDEPESWFLSVCWRRTRARLRVEEQRTAASSVGRTQSTRARPRAPTEVTHDLQPFLRTRAEGAKRVETIHAPQ